MLNPTIEICTRGVDVHCILTGCVYVFVAINIPTLPICGSCAAKTDQCGFVFWANEFKFVGTKWTRTNEVPFKYNRVRSNRSDNSTVRGKALRVNPISSHSCVGCSREWSRNLNPIDRLVISPIHRPPSHSLTLLSVHLFFLLPNTRHHPRVCASHLNGLHVDSEPRLG